MNILLFSSAPAASGSRSGGSIVWSQSFVRMMRKIGHEVHIVTYGDNFNVSECEEFKKNICFVSFTTFLSRVDPVIFKNVICMIKAAREASRIAKATHSDIVVVSSIYEAGALFFTKLACPVIVMCHGYYPYELDSWFNGKRKYPRVFMYKALEQLGKIVLDGMVCPSSWLKNRLIGRHINKDIRVIGSMRRECPTRRYGYSRASLGIKSGTPLVVSYNIMTAKFYHDSYLIYLDTIREVLKIDKNIQFLLFGVINSSFSLALERAKDLPIKIMGMIENTFEILEMADIFLHISLIDTFSITTLEAMSVGVPVIVTDRGALSETVENEKTGLVVDLDSHVAAMAVIDLLQNKEKTAFLSKNAVEYSKRFDENTIAKAWEEFLVTTVNKEKN
jgi:glycosyltransferase involved in cell wall biosynthesis